MELGAGEGRTLIDLAERFGHDVTAVDFSPTALRDGKSLAETHGVTLRTIKADLRSWSPERSWDVAFATYVQLLPDERPAFFELMREVVRSGGWILGEWFRPAHLQDDQFARVGPSTMDRMVAIEELRDSFDEDEILLCEQADVELEEGPLLRGPAAVVQLIARKAES